MHRSSEMWVTQLKSPVVWGAVQLQLREPLHRFGNDFAGPKMFVSWSCFSCRHRYSQYLTAQVLSKDGSKIQTKSSFYHYLHSVKWLPAYRPIEEDKVERNFVLPSSVYLSSHDVHSLLGNHVCYVDISPSQFSMDLGNSSAVVEIACLLGPVYIFNTKFLGELDNVFHQEDVRQYKKH